VRLKFNLEQNYATISPELEGAAAISFPYAQFKTSITEARWDLNTQKITMTKAPDVPIENSYFYTTRKDLDSLRFNAEKAEYDIQLQKLKVSGIPYIIVADAKITPENNEVLILENAKIGQLGIRIGLGWAKSHFFTTGQCPVMKYHRQLMQAILHDKIKIAKAVNVTVISLDQAPQGYHDFDKGAAKKYVIDPHGMLVA